MVHALAVELLGSATSVLRPSLGSYSRRCVATATWSSAPVFGSKLKRSAAKSRRAVRAQSRKLDNDGFRFPAVSRAWVNLVATGGLAYLAVTGKLGWIFDIFWSLWLFFLVAPLIAVVIYFWFLEREISTSNCPNCGNEFRIFKFAMDESFQLCPYCSQPFRVDETGVYSAGDGFTSSTTSDPLFDKEGMIVDVEAKVLDD